MLKAIQIQDYWVIVSDEEITIGDKFESENKIFTCIKRSGRYIEANDARSRAGITSFDKTICKKLIAQNKKVHEGIDLFDAPWEEDVEKLYLETFPLSLFDDIKEGFIKGYEAAKEKYKYTAEDAKKIWEAAINYNNDTSDMPMADSTSKSEPNLKTLLQFLNKKEYEITLGDEKVNGKVIIKSYKQI